MGRGERQPDLRDVFALRVAVAAHELRSHQFAGRGLEGEQLAEVCGANDECWALLENAAEQFKLSARAHQRVLRVSRTIADLAESAEITAAHVAEALSLRCLDRRP